MPIVQCPRCQSELDVDDADIGHKVECPQCQAIFPAVMDDDRGWRKRDSRPRYDGDDDDNEYEYDRYDPVRDEARARKAVGAPAKALMIVSFVTAGLSGLVAIGFFVGSYFAFNQAGNKNAGDPGTILVIYGSLGLYGVAFSGFVGFAAAKARDPIKTAWGYVASITGFTTFLFCHPLNPYTWCAIGFGIWLLIAMNKPEVQRFVKRSLRDSRPRRNPPRDDDDAPR